MIPSSLEQLELFKEPSDSVVLAFLLSMPKIELHQHLTGSIASSVAVATAARHGVAMPTYIEAEFEDWLYRAPVLTVEDYFAPWEALNKLFVSRAATMAIVRSVIRRAAEEKLVYLELRASARGFLGYGRFRFPEFIESITEATAAAEAEFGVTTRWILGLTRHIFGRIPADTRFRMFAQMVRAIRNLRPSYFVGVDLDGIETAAGPEEFQSCFRYAHDRGLHVTIHAGELGSARNVEYAVRELGASRIGHGLAAASDPAVLSLLASRDCALEICPTSNRLMKLIAGPEDIPLRMLSHVGTPFVICTDNPVRCRTRLHEELFRIIRAFNLEPHDLRLLSHTAVNQSFADEATKARVRLELDVWWSSKPPDLSWSAIKAEVGDENVSGRTNQVREQQAISQQS